jgi:hypothetical protein
MRKKMSRKQKKYGKKKKKIELTRCINLSNLLPVQHVSGILMPIIRSLSTAVAASGLPLEHGGSSVFGCGRSGLTATNDTATTMFQQ